jgi:uncharacterized protein YndB with AHSA1/START domain
VTSQTPETSSRLVLRRTFPASRERVFRAWVEADALRRWFNPMPLKLESAAVDARVGGEFRLDLVSPAGERTSISGRYIEIAPPTKLVFTWVSVTTNYQDTLVTVEFIERGAQTDVILTHERLTDESIFQMHLAGWAACIEQLEFVLAS